ncbi:unnamed protein product [Cuscuta epithymum]|uniref:Uncharacterized protein n=1 Tax=Cuscuta epithymum TaxID=186058 RepID=A0AAV0CAP2_9ASTE|nr:unnamed protein product [Cuscuta epithymum]
MLKFKGCLHLVLRMQGPRVKGRILTCPVLPEDHNMYTDRIVHVATEAKEENSNAVVGELQNGLQTDPVMNVVAELKGDTDEEHMSGDCPTPTDLLISLNEVGDDSALTPHAPFANLDWDLGDEVGTGGVDMMALEEASMKEVRKRKRLPSKYICSPFIAPAAKRPKVGGTISRALLQQSDEECQSFKAWVEEDDEVEPCVIEIVIPSSYPTNRVFFRELIDETGWLSSQVSQYMDYFILQYLR